MKPITAIVPDFREALDDGLKEAVGGIVKDLQEKGPYWTGQFANLWKVNPGKQAIKPLYPAISPTPRRPIRPKQFQTVDIPESPNLGGYRIGNEARYRLFAMDLVPTPRGRQGGKAPNATAMENWFDTYYNSQIGRRINTELMSVFRRYK